MSQQSLIEVVNCLNGSGELTSPHVDLMSQGQQLSII